MAETQALVEAEEPARGMLVVLNERPPFVGGQILNLIKEMIVAQRDRPVRIFDYEHLVESASGWTRWYPDDVPALERGRGFMGSLDYLEDGVIRILEHMLEAGTLVLCSGWMRQGPKGRSLMEKFIRLARGTGSLVLWANALAGDPELGGRGEELTLERAAAIVEDVRWSGDDADAVCSLELIDPHDQQGWDLRGVKVKRFDFHEADKGDIVDDLFARVNYWDLRGPI
jgi:hypothetical protein